MQQKWAQIQSILDKHPAPDQVRTWLFSLQPGWEEDGLVLHAQTEQAASHIRTWYGSRLSQAVRELCGPDCPVKVVAHAGPTAEENQMAHGVSSMHRNTDEGPGREGRSLLIAPAEAGKGSGADKGSGKSPEPGTSLLVARIPAASPGHAAPPMPAASQARVLPSPRPLPAVQLALPQSPGKDAEGDRTCQWRYSFDDFVVGPCNELAYAASRNMCGEFSQSDILFLSSPPGLGKTHLLHAVGSALSAACNRRRPVVQYLTAEEFASRFYLSLKGQDTDRFKACFRNLDLLLLEDVHFLQGKEKMQAELLATVKALRDRGGKVVFSSSFAPRDLKQMDDQLHSRLSAGLLSCIERPDEETRRRILRRKASLHQVMLPEDVEDMLARYIHSDVRQIESCLQNLILKARLLNSRITAQMAWEIIANYASHSPLLDMESIISQVCRGFRLSREQLTSASRKQEYVSARNTAFYLARKHTELSLEAIGRQFNRKHSTVLKGITSLEREISRQSPLGRQIANTLTMIERNGNIFTPANAPTS